MAKGGAEHIVPISEAQNYTEVRDITDLRVSHNKILETKTLPTLPSVAYRLLDLLAKDPEVHELEEVIRYDQSLTAKILSIANSAYTNVQQEIDTIQRAIVTLGVKEVTDIAFGVCLASVLKPIKSIPFFDVKEFWLHCVATAITSRIIAQALDHKDEDRFFTLGLLHDIGRLVLLYLFPETFEEILERRSKSGRELLLEEIDAGLAHTWLGRWLIKRWGLPEGFEVVARFHHHPFQKGRFLVEPAIVKLADLTTHQLGLARLEGGQRGEVGPLLQKLGLDEDLYAAIQDHLHFIRENLLEAWGSFL